MSNVTVSATVAPVRASDGTRLHTAAYGPDSAPLTVVLLHGWTLDHRLWRRQIGSLLKRLGRNASILNVDLRGHGRSGAGPRRSTTMEQLADDLSAVIRDRVPAGRVVLVGHSLGGMTIFEYAHRHRIEFTERVAGVVLVSTTAEGCSRTTYGLPRRLARLVRTLEISGAGLLARTGPWRPHRHLMPLLTPGVRWLVFGSHAEADVIRLAIAMVGTATLSSIGGFRPSVRLHHRVDALARLRDLPVAVLVGTRDRLTPNQCAETIAGALPNAWLNRLQDAGHMLPLERPAEVTDAIVRVCRSALERAGGARPPVQPGPRVRERLSPTARSR